MWFLQSNVPTITFCRFADNYTSIRVICEQLSCLKSPYAPLDSYCGWFLCGWVHEQVFHVVLNSPVRAVFSVVNASPNTGRRKPHLTLNTGHCCWSCALSERVQSACIWLDWVKCLHLTVVPPRPALRLHTTQHCGHMTSCVAYIGNTSAGVVI